MNKHLRYHMFMATHMYVAGDIFMHEAGVGRRTYTLAVTIYHWENKY